MLAVWMMGWVFGSAWAASCSDLPGLELRAARARLPEPIESCLQERLDAERDAEDRAKASFVLILSAYSGKALDLYGERMQRHLAAYHTTDPEVAYLYARYLWKRSGETGNSPYTDEILRWSRVAMDGRTRWLHNRRNYDEMVRNLYDMLVQSSLQSAIQQQQVYADAPTDDHRLAADEAQRRARHMLIVAAPCLHRGECGPTFEVIVEGMRECEDLAPLEDYASAGRLDDGHRACLRARFRRPGAPKRRILDILADDASNRDDPTLFEFLMAWHWNITERDDPDLAYRFAAWLAEREGSPDLLAQWSEAALATGSMRDDQSVQLVQWRVRGWAAVVDAARAADAKQSTERTRRELERAEGRFEEARTARDSFCKTRSCPEDAP